MRSDKTLIMMTNRSGPDMHFLNDLQLVHNQRNYIASSPSFMKQ